QWCPPCSPCPNNSWARFASDGIHQTLPCPPRRSRTSRRKRHQGHVPPDCFQLAPARGTLRQMILHRKSLVTLQPTQGVECEILRELFVYVHATNVLRNASRPLRMRVVIVTSGSPVFAAISPCVNPSKYAISSALRWAWSMIPNVP